MNICTVKAISYAGGFRQLKTALFDWILPVALLIVSRVDFVVFVLFLEAVGVGEYCCTAVWQSKIDWRLCQLCFARSSPATRASRVLGEQRVLRARRTFVQASWWRWAQPKAAKAMSVALHSAESRQSDSRRSCCWQNSIDNARYCCRVIHAAGERS